MHLLFNILSFVPLVYSYSHQGTRLNHHRRHSTLSRLQPRGFRATFYDVGLGACGKTNVPSDLVVALNSAQFDSAPDHDCFKTITITCNGKTTNAQIVDRCPGCPYGGLDMSTSLFQFFQPDLGVGVLDVDWDFADGGAPNQAPPPPSSSQAPSPPSTPKPSKTKASQTSAPTTSTQIQLPSSQATSDVQSSTSAVLSSSTGETSTAESPTPSTSTAASLTTAIVSDPSSSPLPQLGGGNNIAQLGSMVVRLGLLVESLENKS